MKKLFENFRKYTLVEEMDSLVNENAQEVAKYMKQLNMIAKNPEEFLKKANEHPHPFFTRRYCQ